MRNLCKEVSYLEMNKLRCNIVLFFEYDQLFTSAETKVTFILGRSIVDFYCSNVISDFSGTLRLHPCITLAKALASITQTRPCNILQYFTAVKMTIFSQNLLTVLTIFIFWLKT